MYQEAINKIRLFNEVGHELSKKTKSELADKIELQMHLIDEELTETFVADCDEDFLDGICDVFVTVVGLLQQAEHFGFDVEKALNAVGDNNLSKFVKGVVTDVTEGHSVYYDEKNNLSIIKNQDGKIMKPATFQKVDLTPYLPTWPEQNEE